MTAASVTLVLLAALWILALGLIAVDKIIARRMDREATSWLARVEGYAVQRRAGCHPRKARSDDSGAER